MATKADLELGAKFFDDLMGHWRAWMICAAIQLDIADHLKHKPLAIEELARLTETNTSVLYRLMRALASFGYFKESSRRVFEMTPLARLMTSDYEYRLKHVGLLFIQEEHLVWQTLKDSIKTGKSSFDTVYGHPYYKYLKENKTKFEIFKKGLHEATNVLVSHIPKIYDFSQYKHIVDIAGNDGQFLIKILESAPKSIGTLFDEAHVIEAAKINVAKSSVKDRFRFESGSFFESVPANGDCYVIKSAICGYDDNDALKIFSNIAKQMKSGSKLLIMNSVVSEDNEKHTGKLFDIYFHVIEDGTERTAKEYETLLNKAGLKLQRVIETGYDLYHIVEAVAP